ncbi:hypothetical protein DVH24_038769 [Malus domestica]|uniref:Uncharacterized protein n=1 Tax=Malus domestica TaxID=3750 RepID=A0A498KFG5_MALDO|nr:hypothetical protein DVH24_038769 [Malus domestica]
MPYTLTRAMPFQDFFDLVLVFLVLGLDLCCRWVRSPFVNSFPWWCHLPQWFQWMHKFVLSDLVFRLMRLGLIWQLSLYVLMRLGLYVSDFAVPISVAVALMVFRCVEAGIPLSEICR